MTQLRLTAPMRRQHILDCALPIFGEHGFHDTSMNDIANAAGITKPVIYQHFASKRDLYSALITELGEEMIATVNELRKENMVTNDDLDNALFSLYILIQSQT